MNPFNDMLRWRDAVTVEHTAVVEFDDGWRDTVSVELPKSATEDEVMDALEHELVRVFGVDDYAIVSAD